MPDLVFDFIDATPGRRTVAVRDLVIAGWTGRDPHKLQEHIDELAALGIAAPSTTPCFYRGGAELLTTATSLDCLGADASGEAEYILLVDEDGIWWIGAGSDHTDRKVEAYSIAVSKQICPKPVAPVLWRFDDVAPHWDALELHSWVEEDGQRVTYQSGSVAAMLDPRETVARLQVDHVLQPGTIMFGGTLPVQGGIRPSRAFGFELHDPVLGCGIGHHYTTRWLPA